MRRLAFTVAMLLSFALHSQAGAITFTFTPASPEVFSVNFGAVTLGDGVTHLPAFTFSFAFNYALNQANYATGFTFKMDNSELNPNTGMPFTTPPITNISAPTLTPTGGPKSTWLFDPALSYLTLSATSVEIGVDYDPPLTSAIFVLDPLNDMVFVPTLENTQVNETGNPSASDNSTTLVETPTPEPATLGMLAAGLAGFAFTFRRKRTRA